MISKAFSALIENIIDALCVNIFHFDEITRDWYDESDDGFLD